MHLQKIICIYCNILYAYNQEGKCDFLERIYGRRGFAVPPVIQGNRVKQKAHPEKKEFAFLNIVKNFSPTSYLLRDADVPFRLGIPVQLHGRALFHARKRGRRVSPDGGCIRKTASAQRTAVKAGVRE
jgi:hypothetical protein